MCDHGLSAHAGEWAEFCTALCQSRGVRVVVARVDVPREPQQSLEAEARRVRYAALEKVAHEAGAHCVLLAHHQDDQAETLLLQLLRGAGPRGLAAMPAAREDPNGVCWLRPLLAVSRAQIDAYAKARALRWIDDDSNMDVVHRRNALRRLVLPALASLNPAYSATLARAAAHQSDAVRLADDLAAIDAAHTGDDSTLDLAAFRALPPHRARNLLRWFLRQRALPAPSTARVEAMLIQLRTARLDASIRLPHAGIEIGVHRGRIVIHPPPAAEFDLRWHGADELVLAHGIVTFRRVIAAGIDEAHLTSAPLRVCSRRGGERLQLEAGGPRRSLKSLLRESAIAPWDRAGWPLVYCGETLAAVAGLLVAPPYRTGPGRPGLAIGWQPRVITRVSPSAAGP